MSLFARERRAANLSTLEGILAATGRAPRGRAARAVTDETALKIAAFTACVNLLSRNIATLPVHAYRKRGKAREEIDPAPAIVQSPSAIVSRTTWVEQIMRSLLMRGNAYGYVTQLDSFGWATKVEILHPDSVHVAQVDQLSPPTYHRRGAGGLVELDPARVMHISAFNMPGSAVGLSPISYMAWTLGLAADAVGYGAEFLGGGGHPTGVLSTDLLLDEDQATRAKRRFKEATEGDQLAVLGGGWQYQAVQISPADAQLLESRQFSAVEICQFMGVPATKIGAAMSGTSVTYANREQNQQEYASDSLLWWTTNVEEAWTAQLQRGQFVRLNLDVLLRPDANTRSVIIDRKLRNGTLNADEARAFDDMPPLPNEQGQLFIWPPIAPALMPDGTPAPASAGAGSSTSAKPDASADDAAAARAAAELLQKGYLAVDKAITADELRNLANRVGAGLDTRNPFSTGGAPGA